jgi:hypothetical protein
MILLLFISGLNCSTVHFIIIIIIIILIISCLYLQLNTAVGTHALILSSLLYILIKVTLLYGYFLWSTPAGSLF